MHHICTGSTDGTVDTSKALIKEWRLDFHVVSECIVCSAVIAMVTGTMPLRATHSHTRRPSHLGILLRLLTVEWTAEETTKSPRRMFEEK
jgi:hypothetical protein